ncbi:zinc finger protein 236-like [Thrips palmi]|uniref:Zinc finger protein 236-like n=1 Tax=Thrips palmi TaxID=161013 RepID=A0A6P8XYA0_THRPL|nr:zinc finger protein 236-like [Thrips palmi]
MRRAKLAAGSVPAGSLPTSSYVVPRCFVCDEPIKSHRFSTSLLAGRTQYTHSPLPTKIGGYIGDEFVVVVTPQDALCKHCMALINTMDRLELELRQHRYTLTQHLKTKYKLDEPTAVSTTKKSENAHVEEVQDEPEIIEVSDEEWTPNSTPHKRQRTESSKQHCCTICGATYTNLSLFMAHLSRHKQISSKTKATSVPVLSTVKTYVSETSSQGLKFKCGCCSESFPTKESLAIHMQQHTVTQAKPKANSALSPNVSKSNNESTLLEIKSEPVVQTSSLFEDIEELSHHEPQAQALGSVGVCTEEQKGRVCLLALLNNGVCSDLSHRAPASGSLQNSPQNSSVLNESKVNVSAGDQTISITVSIPSCLDGGPMMEQQLSIPAVSHQSSNSTCLSFPVTFTNSPVTSTLVNTSFSVIDTQINKLQENNLNTSNQNALENHSSSLQNNCLDLPDLCDPFPEVANQVAQNSPELVTKGNNSKKASPAWGRKILVKNITDHAVSTPTSIMPSSRLVQSMDMPSLLEEDMLPNEDSNQETFRLASGEVRTFESGKNTESLGRINTSSQPDLTGSLNKNGTDSVKNIAIVSVTSVQVNKDSYDENNIVSDWFYASSGKDISPVLEGQKAKDIDAPAEASWFPESDQISVSEKLHNEKCSAAGYSTDSCISSQKLTTEGSKLADN